MRRFRVPGGVPARCNISMRVHAERRRDLPRGNGDWKIPRCNDPDHADGLAGNVDVHAGAHRRKLLAGQTQRLAGEELQNLAGPHDFPDAFRAGLALLARE